MGLVDVKAVHPHGRGLPDAVVKVELDERAFLFPETKLVTQLHLLVYKPHKVRFEAVYAFNESRASPELFELTAEDARQLAKKLVETVYRAQSSQIVSRETSLGITVTPNGYILQLGGVDAQKELTLSTGCIWRVCAAITRAVDFLSPIASH